MNRIDSYIEKILSRTECGREERNDLFEEFKSHLESAKKDYIVKGYSAKKAERLAINDFGEEEQIGDQLQQTLYPYRKMIRKILMLFIGIGSITFGILTHLHYASKSDGSPFLWAFFITSLGVTVIILSFNPTFTKNHKILVSCILIGLNVFYFYGWGLLDTFIDRYATWLNNLRKSLALVSIIMIFLIALRPSSNEKQMPRQRMIHIFNILVGILVLGWALIYSFGILVFAGLHSALLIPIGAVLLWVLSYWIQHKMVLNHKGITVVFSFLTITIPILIFYQYYG